MALAEGCFRHGVGAKIDFGSADAEQIVHNLFREYSSAVLLSCDPSVVARIQVAADESGAVWPANFGETTANRFEILADGIHIINEFIAELKQPWSQSLEQTLHDHTANEVLA